MTSESGPGPTAPALPTIPECEKALNLPVMRWAGNCHSVAHQLIESGLVRGTTRYGFYFGPVARTSYFSHTAPFHRHGWVELPGGVLVVDPTRWVFEDREPYLYCGPYGDDYDPGMQRLARAKLRPCPGRVPGESAVDFHLSAAAAQHLADMTGEAAAFSDEQIFWLGNLPLCMLGPHCAEVYQEIARVGRKAYIPWDNWKMATDEGGPPAHALRDPCAGPPRPGGP